MSTTIMTSTALGTSNLRGGPSRLTRSNPARASKGLGSAVLRQNSLVSNSGLPLASSSHAIASQSQNNNDPPGMYPAITHFSDAIAALPREYRRHTSLLKEVDAKAWGPEESLQTILDQCLADSTATTINPAAATQSLTGSTTADDPPNVSEVNSVAGISLDNASLVSARSADPITLHRRQQYHALRQNLMAIMVTMDEKNHVINNANEEVSRHIRRLDRIWPHITEEISEEARLGSLKHWAYTETNPTKKQAAPITRREAAAASLATLHESEAAHRSQDRREAVRRQRTIVQHADSDFDETKVVPPRKTTANGKKRAAEAIPDTTGLGISGTGPSKRKRPEKSALGGIGMERSISSALGGRPMSRENSQQEITKKRKASTTATSVARKRYVLEVTSGSYANALGNRLNAVAQDSPKLASSPLAGTAAKEAAYKRSPALSNVRPATGRGRQNSTNTLDSVKGGRPSSLTSNRNGNGSNAASNIASLTNAATVASKTAGEVKHSKETKADRRERLVEEKPSAINGTNGDHLMRASLLLERSSSRHENIRADARDGVSTKAVASPRLPALQTSELKIERSVRGRASKTSTPIVGTFADADAADSASANENWSRADKLKRPPRNRIKDHGLHDSLSPKGLPMKRPHKKSGSLSFPSTISSTSNPQRLKDDEPRTKSSTPSDIEVPPISSITTDVQLDAAEEDEDEHEAAEDDEERYCYCQGVSYGEMVACDRDDCPRQWFHLDCIGLKSVPKSAKWYCNECKEVLAQREGL